MRRSHSRGFTLVEAIVAIAVLGILLTLAVPGMQKIVAKQRLRSASYDLVADLTLARSESLKRGTPVVLEPLRSGDWTAGWRLRNGADNAILGQHSPPGIPVVLRSALDNTLLANVTFDGSAQVSSGASVQFGLNDGHGNFRCVQLDPTGRAKSLSTACP